MRKKRRNRQIVVAVNGGNALKGMFLFMTSLIVIFVLSGVLTSLRPELRLSSDSLHGIAGELPGDAFAHLLGMENHYFASELPEKDSFQLSRLSLKLATSINMEDPRSFLGRELRDLPNTIRRSFWRGRGRIIRICRLNLRRRQR